MTISRDTLSGWFRRATLVRAQGGSLGELFDNLAAAYGERPLVEEAEPIGLAGDQRSLTYRAAADIVAMGSAAIAADHEPGAAVVVRGDNGYGFLLACLAVARAGCVVVPVNPHMGEAEVDHVVQDADAAVVTVGDLADAIGAGSPGDAASIPARPIEPDETAGIFYTSGTTGKPKGARLTSRGLLGVVVRGALAPTELRRDELVCALPVAHIMGFEALLGAACAGIPVFSIPKFRPDQVLDAIESRRSTAFVGVPAMYRMLVEAGAEDRDLRSVRLWLSGADAMPEDLARRFKKMGASATLPLVGWSLGEAMFVEGYGMVETAGGASIKVSPPLMPFGLGESLGIPLPPYKFKVVDDSGNEVRPGEVGELLLKGPGALQGYHGNEEATAAILTDDGWVRTGDLARRGMFGVFEFAGRKKDVIKNGGYSVFAAEVEEVLRGYDGVGDVAVVGRPDAKKGEVPYAFVQVAPGAQVDAEQLRAWASDHLAKYKAPVKVELIDELPRTGTGKVSKPDLRARFAADD